VPIHQLLSERFDPDRGRRLERAHWLRTLAFVAAASTATIAVWHGH
jgi:hypothetical protein